MYRKTVLVAHAEWLVTHSDRSSLKFSEEATLAVPAGSVVLFLSSTVEVKQTCFSSFFLSFGQKIILAVWPQLPRRASALS